MSGMWRRVWFGLYCREGRLSRSLSVFEVRTRIVMPLWLRHSVIGSLMSGLGRSVGLFLSLSGARLLFLQACRSDVYYAE